MRKLMTSSLKTDVLIVGSGIAGLTSAIKLSEEGLHVTIISREENASHTNTSWAQGGIIYSPNNEKSIELFVQDILEASSYTANVEAAQLIANRSSTILKEILINKAKTSFETDQHGQLLFTKEAAHSVERIIYKGDYTGKSIQESLFDYVNKLENVRILTHTTAIDLITPNHHGVELNQRYENNKVIGAYLFDQRNERVIKLISKVTILASGGIGALYLHNSNAESARGDGHAMAKRAGAQVTNMEFIQFHPTTFYSENSKKRFLITEALRGEGGVLLNKEGKRFMSKYHKDLELAPRDVVSRAILNEMLSNKENCVYLDISHKKAQWIKERFPTIYHYCLEHKVDMTREPIPVVPAAHYTCGGVKSDLKARTNLEGLYVVGEVACTGLHGANRLASTSLLEGLTMGYLAAEDIVENIQNYELYHADRIQDWSLGSDQVDLGLIAQDISSIKQTMWNYVGLVRSKNRLGRARALFRELSDEIHKFYKHAKLHDELIGLRNAIEVADMVLMASYRNSESVGCFYREN
jgi:L-aspartate oxidase